jgi:hypothetical protein
MLDSTPTYRIVMTAFPEFQTLWCVLDDLVVEGFTAAQLCLLSSRFQMAANFPPYCSASASRDELAKLLKMVAAIRPVDEGDILPSLSTAVREMFLSGQPSIAMTSNLASRWLASRRLKDLNAQIRDGALILLASSTTPDQQRRAARVVLKYSSHAIFACEFTRASPS